MRTIKLKAFSLKNFMGVKFYEKTGLEVGSWDASADNGFGKSTIPKGFLWTVESYMPDDFKPHDKSGIEIPGLTTKTEYTLDIDGQEVCFSKTAKDQIDKKTGQKKANAFKYYINAVEYKKTDYVNKIHELFDTSANILKLLLMPLGFDHLKWLEFRQIIVDLLSEQADIDFIETSKWVALQTHMQGGFNLAYLARQLKQQIKYIEGGDDGEGGLNRLNILLQDKTQNIKEVAKPEEEKIEAELKALGDKLLFALSDSDSAIPMAEYKAQKIELESTIKALETEQDRALDEVKWQISDAIREKEGLETQRAILQAKQEMLETQRDGLGAQWTAYKEQKKQVAAGKISDICFNCNQSIPPELLEALTAKSNNEKAEEIKRLTDLQVQTGEKGQPIAHAIEQIAEQIAAIKCQITEKENEIKTLEEEEKRQKENGVAEQIKKLNVDIANAKQNLSIAQSKQDNDKEVKVLKDKIAALKTDKERYDTAKRDYAAYLRAKADIEKLKKEITTLSKKLSAKRKLQDDVKSATLAKYKGMEEQINALFPTVKIQLFDFPMQGEVKETCKVVMGGVEFNSGLNTAGRIKADLEIKQVVMKHHKIKIPVFIDDVNLVTRIDELDTQCFFLKVKEGVKELEWREV